MAEVGNNKYWGAAAEVLSSLNEQAALDRAQDNLETNYQKMMDARRQGLQKEQTNAATMAKFNAIGNALRTMVQPLGWAVGGATAGVQKYDERAYLDAYNRSVKAGADLRNLDAQDMQFRLNQDAAKVADAKRELEARKAQQAKEAAEERRLQNELALIDARAQAKKDIASGDSVDAATQKRASTAYANYLARTLGKGTPISYDEFLNYFVRENAEEPVAEAGGTVNPVAATEIAGPATVEAPATATAEISQNVKPAAKPVSKVDKTPAAATSTTKDKTSAKQSVYQTTEEPRNNAGYAVSKGGAYARMMQKKAAKQGQQQGAAKEAAATPQTAAEKWGGKAKKKKK